MPYCVIAEQSSHESPLGLLELDEAAQLELEDRRIDYLPTTLEISQACARIRSEWSLNEHRRRFVGEYTPDELLADWRPPVIDTSHFRLTHGGGREGV